MDDKDRTARKHLRRVGMLDIAQTLGEVQGSVIGLHEKVDSIKESVQSNAEKIQHNSRRIGRIERIVVGVSSVLVVIWSGLVYFKDEVKRWLMSGGSA